MRDLSEASVYENYAVPKIYLKQYYCISAALSLGTRAAEFSQRTKRTCPRPFLLRPLFRRFKQIRVSLLDNRNRTQKWDESH